MTLKRKSATLILLIFALSALEWRNVVPEAHALAHSNSVAYVVSPGHDGCEGFGTASLGYADPRFDGCSVFVNAVTGSVPTGGVYTTSGGSTVNFTNVPVGTIDTLGVAAISGLDTVFLYEVCDFGSHTGLVSALNSYLSAGGNHKVIIYDGDKCSTAAGFGIDPNYSAFLFPFTSSNPGPKGATGTVTLVEPETLPAVLTRNVATGFVGSADAIGDSNTFTSNTGGWCAAVKGTNINGVTNIQVGYARTPSGGLVIYNGQDNWATFSANAWDKQLFDNALDQPFNPDSLPCVVPTNGIGGGTGPGGQSLNSTLPVGGSATITARVTNTTGGGLPGIPVNFNVTSGPNTGTAGTNTTRTNGIATFTYSDTGGPGTDTVVASFTDRLGVHSTQGIIVNWKSTPLKLSKFFTRGEDVASRLRLDSKGNPKVDVVSPGGVVRSTNPGQVRAWVNVTNTDGPLQSLKLNDTLPVDWTVDPPWMPAKGAIHVFVANTTSPRGLLEITDPSTITVSTANPEVVHLAIPDFNSTALGHPLLKGQSILLSVKLSYALKGTSQPASSYPRNYTDTATATGWTKPSYTGTTVGPSTGMGFFTAYAKLLGDVNGDNKVDIRDVALVAYAYASRTGDTRWNPAADFNNDGVIDINDVAIVALYYGTSL